MSLHYPLCSSCNNPPSHMSCTYDRAFCKSCDVWVEKECTCKEEDGCSFPKANSDHPSKCGELDEEKL